MRIKNIEGEESWLFAYLHFYAFKLFMLFALFVHFVRVKFSRKKDKEI